MAHWKCSCCGAPLESERCSYCHSYERPDNVCPPGVKSLRDYEFRICNQVAIYGGETETTYKTYTYAELMAAGYTDKDMRRMLGLDKPAPTSVPSFPSLIAR